MAVNLKPKAKITKTDSAWKSRCRVMESQIRLMLETRVELVMINDAPKFEGPNQDFSLPMIASAWSNFLNLRTFTTEATLPASFRYSKRNSRIKKLKTSFDGRSPSMICRS